MVLGHALARRAEDAVRVQLRREVVQTRRIVRELPLEVEDGEPSVGGLRGLGLIAIYLGHTPNGSRSRYRRQGDNSRTVYHSVGEQHLQSYINEYAFRYNNRDNPYGMFNAFLGRIEKASPVPVPDRSTF